MIVLEWIRFFAGTAFLIGGLVVFTVEFFGVFKFNYVLNRMQIAAAGDTLGIVLCMLGLIIMSGLNYNSLKMVLVIVFLWFASPVASHMLARFEVTTNEELEKECEILTGDKNPLKNDRKEG